MSTSRQITILTLTAFLVSVNFFCVIHLSAETNSSEIDFEDYRGLWLSEIDNEEVYILIKKNKLASYFYKNRDNNEIHKARWNRTKNTLLISSLDFVDLKFCIEGICTDNQLKSNKGKINILKKVPKEILGDWARPPGYKIPKNEYMPSSYFGFWQTIDSENARVIKVSENRTVISFKKTLSQIEEKNALEGEWFKHGQQLHIAWENGSYSIIDNSNKNKIKIYDFQSGEEILEEKEYISITQIQKESKAFENFNKFKEALNRDTISLSHLDYKSLLKFYRGSWITLDEITSNAFEIMRFNRFGGVNLASNKKTKGNWYLSGTVCIINLDDGIRMRLKPVGSAFIAFIYEANRPLDGYPNKVLKAAPLSPQKLDLLDTDAFFTQKLQNKFIQFKPIHSKDISLISNWPTKDTANSSANNPWWWPIWSDNADIKTTNAFSENNTSAPLTNNEESIASITEENQTNSQNPIDALIKSKWEWPF